MKRSIIQCVCHRRTFRELQEYCEKYKINDVEELIERRMCGCGCAMCVPYVQLMLKTGETVFKPGAILQRQP